MTRPAIRIEAVDNRDRASSRLRAWMLAEFLRSRGFETHVNEGAAFDVLVCQKTYPFALARAARRDGKAVLFDLDDPDFDRSTRWMEKIRRFTALAHVVTTGSDYLRRRLAVLHPRVVVIENPVDVTAPEVAHPGGSWGGRLVWFGFPENLWMLRRLNLRSEVRTVTRGGDIPFSLQRIDRVLCGFDLALLPVALTDETRGKNANRLIKCAALGLPFLASDTPEHRKAIRRLKMPPAVLVGDDRDWDAAIESAARSYPERVAVARVGRPAAWQQYGADRVFGDWLAVCLDTWRRARREAAR